MKSHLSMKLKPNCYWTSTTYHLMSSWDSFKIFFWIWFSITQKQDLDGEEKERKPKILNEHNRALLIMETRFIHDVFSWSQNEYQTHSKAYTPSCSLYTCNINHLLKSGRFLSIVVSTKAMDIHVANHRALGSGRGAHKITANAELTLPRLSAPEPGL